MFVRAGFDMISYQFTNRRDGEGCQFKLYFYFYVFFILVAVDTRLIILAHIYTIFFFLRCTR